MFLTSTRRAPIRMAMAGDPSVLPLSATMISPAMLDSRNTCSTFWMQVDSVSASFRQGRTTDSSGTALSTFGFSSTPAGGSSSLTSLDKALIVYLRVLKPHHSQLRAFVYLIYGTLTRSPADRSERSGHLPQEAPRRGVSQLVCRCFSQVSVQPRGEVTTQEVR